MAENKKEKSVLSLALVCLELKKQIRKLQKHEKKYKDELKHLMKDYDVKYAKNEMVEVKVNYPKSFDVGTCRMYNPSEVKKFTKEETVTSINEIFDKKGFKKFYPELFEEYNISLTPRLTVK